MPHFVKFKLCILGAWLTTPSIALSVILQSVRSKTRKFSAVCRKFKGGSCSNHVVGRCGRDLSREELPLGVGDASGSRRIDDGKALSDKRGLLATLRVRNFL